MDPAPTPPPTEPTPPPAEPEAPTNEKIKQEVLAKFAEIEKKIVEVMRGRFGSMETELDPNKLVESILNNQFAQLQKQYDNCIAVLKDYGNKVITFPGEQFKKYVIETLDDARANNQYGSRDASWQTISAALENLSKAAASQEISYAIQTLQSAATNFTTIVHSGNARQAMERAYPILKSELEKRTAEWRDERIVPKSLNSAESPLAGLKTIFDMLTQAAIHGRISLGEGNLTLEGKTFDNLVNKFFGMLEEGTNNTYYANVNEVFFTQDLWYTLKEFLKFLHSRAKSAGSTGEAVKIPAEEIENSSQYVNLQNAIKEFGESQQAVGKDSAKRYLGIIREYFQTLLNNSISAISEFGVKVDDIAKLFNEEKQPRFRLGTGEADQQTLNDINSFLVDAKKAGLKISSEGSSYLAKLLRQTNVKGNMELMDAVNAVIGSLKQITDSPDYSVF